MVQPSGLIIPSKIQYEFARVVSRQSCRQIWGLPVPDDVHFYGHRRDIAQLLATVQRSIRRESILYFFSVEWLRTGWRPVQRWCVIIGVLS